MPEHVVGQGERRVVWHDHVNRAPHRSLQLCRQFEVPEAQHRVTGAVTASFRLVLFQGGASAEYGASPRAWSVQVSLASSLE